MIMGLAKGPRKGNLSLGRGEIRPPVLIIQVTSYTFFFQLKNFIFNFWLRWVFVALSGLSLVVVSGCYSLVAMGGLLIVVVSLVAKHGL